MRTESELLLVKPTIYKGILMRSKTEARAAEWFESLGWSWVYEPETFIMEKEQYTPDFYIPEIDTLIEIKPLCFMGETMKVYSFAERIKKTFAIIYPDGRSFNVFTLYGKPDPCDGSTKMNGEFRWSSHIDSGDFVSIDNKHGHFACNMIYMGSGCGNSNYIGNCCCTR